MCSFSDKELMQYISWKKDNFYNAYPRCQSKHGVLTLGKQKCGEIWVFSKDAVLSNNGMVASSHNYFWLKNTISLGGNSKKLSLEEISYNIKVLPFSDEVFHQKSTLSHLLRLLRMTSSLEKLLRTSHFQVPIAEPPIANKPLSTQSPTIKAFSLLLNTLETCLDHNFFSCVSRDDKLGISLAWL